MGNFFSSSDKNSTINLSQDVLSKVMTFLTEKEIVQLSLTSKQFHSCSNEQTIWKQKLKTLLSTKYSPPKDLNWKQEYINKRFLFNSTTKVNPEFYNEISRQVNKHNGRIIPGEAGDSYIQSHVHAKKFSCLTYYSRDIPGFGNVEFDMFFIEYQNKLYRLFENFTGVIYKKVDSLESETNKQYILQMEDYGEIIEKIDFKPIIHKEMYELLSKSFSSADSLREIIQFLYFLKFYPSVKTFETNILFTTSKNVDELFQLFKDIKPKEFSKHGKETLNENILRNGEHGNYSIEFGIRTFNWNMESDTVAVVLKNYNFEIDAKDFQLNEKKSQSEFINF
jgi:hypothetical protein